MPKTAIDIDCCFIFWQYNIWFTRIPFLIIINSCCIYVCYLLVESALLKAYFTYSFKKLVKVLLCQNSAAVFQALIIHNKAFDSELLYDSVCPLTELHSTLVIYLKAYGNYHLQVVVIGIITFAVSGSYSEFPNN